MITYRELHAFLTTLINNKDDRINDNVTIMRQDGEYMAVDDIFENETDDVLGEGHFFLKEL